MKKLSMLQRLFACAALAFLAGCNEFARAGSVSTSMPDAVPADAEDEDDEVLLRPDQIPAVIRELAEAEVPGLVIEEAEKERDGGRTMYCVHGRADGEFYEIEIGMKGRVFEVDHGEDDDDEDDD